MDTVEDPLPTRTQAGGDPSGVSWEISGFADEISPDPGIQAAVLTALGVKHVDLRSAWDVNVTDLTADHIGRLKELFSRYGIAVQCLASPIGKVEASVPVSYEVDRLRHLARVARAFDARQIRIFSFYPRPGQQAPDIRDEVLPRMQALVRAAHEEDVELLLENEKGIYGDTPERVRDIVDNAGDEGIAVVWDAANFVQVGVQPLSRAWPLLGQFVRYVHIKDALFDDGRVVPAGQGDGDVAQTLTTLRDQGFDGPLSLEPHLASSSTTGGFSGPEAFGIASRALSAILDSIGVDAR